MGTAPMMSDDAEIAPKAQAPQIMPVAIPPPMARSQMMLPTLWLGGGYYGGNVRAVVDGGVGGWRREQRSSSARISTTWHLCRTLGSLETRVIWRSSCTNEAGPEWGRPQKESYGCSGTGSGVGWAVSCARRVTGEKCEEGDGGDAAYGVDVHNGLGCGMSRRGYVSGFVGGVKICVGTLLESVPVRRSTLGLIADADRQPRARSGSGKRR